MPEKLGYKGFLVSAENDEKDYLIPGHTTKDLQKALLDSIPPGTIPLKLKKNLAKSILSVKPLAITHSNKVTKREAPSYDRLTRKFWTSFSVQRRNNCYNYATDIPTFTFAQPGTGTGRMFKKMTKTDVRNSAIRDGLIVYNYKASAPPAIRNHRTRRLVALFVEPDVGKLATTSIVLSQIIQKLIKANTWLLIRRPRCLVQWRMFGDSKLGFCVCNLKI